MKGGGPSIDWTAFSPHIGHPTRKSIVEALRCKGALSGTELGDAVDDASFSPAHLNYHAKVLVERGVLKEGRRQAPESSIECIYSLALNKS
jgi:DNA-binding transcriptional ArsR family regulator